MTAARRSGRLLLGLVRGLAVLVGVVLVGAVVPFAWIWVGSQLQGGTAPSSHTLEQIVVAATLLVGLGCTIFFLPVRGSRRPRGHLDAR